MKRPGTGRMTLITALLVLLAMTGGPTRSCSMEPPTPGEIATFRQEGEWEQRKTFARDIGNQRIRPDLLKRALQRARRAALSARGVSTETIDRLAPAAPPRALAGMPTTGNVKTFALLIDFPDYPHTSPLEYIHERLFGAGNPADAPLESLAAFYRRSSYGLLELSGGSTLGWYRTSYNRSAVAQTLTGRESLIKEALNYFQGQGHDFSQYDNNGDGMIDYFIVIWTGPDNGWANFWWGYQTNFNDATYRIGGKRLNSYSWQWESRPAAGYFSPRVSIHETGHALGLPDYYDYDAAIGPDGGVGKLDMMDGNWGDHNCFSKWVLEWITPTVVSNGAQTLTLYPSAATTNAVLIMPGITLDNTFSEFFMVQNRYRVGNDTTIPSDGLLVWHVDAALTTSGYDFLYNNSYTTRKLLRLMEADGREEIERNIPANPGDFYRPGARFGATTLPSSANYSGQNTGVLMTGITQSGDGFSATLSVSDLGRPLAPPGNVTIQSRN